MYENFLGNKTAWKILRLLSEAPGRATSRKEIKEITKAGNFALSEAIEKLLAYKILNKKKVGKKEFYWINVANPISKILIDFFNLEKERLKGLKPSEIIFLSKVVNKIWDKLKPKKIILFGSHAKGLATEESDFDLCVIVEKKVKKSYIATIDVDEKVEIHLFEEKEFEELKRKKDKLVEEILKDGIELI